MEPLRKAKRLEKDIEREVRRQLVKLGWNVEKTHGSLYMKGWPDLFLAHRVYGCRWVEMKRPGDGALTPSQVALFTRWRRYGIAIYILTKVEDIKLLKGPGNWYIWLDSKLKGLL